MGVPKFFRWLSERYPCLSEELKEYQIPEFDNLYLDMNGIIHVCSHPNDFDPHFRISEEQIFTDIFHYIEVLFRLIRPKKLFFMAVDGVAPRAKMNQQRGRRFSSAKEAEVLEKKALEKGESLPSEKRFDSNCITPGTRFMAKLQEQLKYFVANKISHDKLWQGPTIILSGHSVPGEGEHKIMDYIRYMRSQPDWDPYTRHCLYGLDADLIMLGLCSHEPNFSLLREEVKFVKNNKSNKRTATPETTNYMLLHLSLLRGYLDLEFQQLKTKLPFPYDIEHIIDDWVLMGFLVGNDFIPHLPNLHIHANALNILYDTYRATLPKLDGYINENGVLNLTRFEKFLEELSKFDTETFEETYADMKFLESKTGRKMCPDPQVEVSQDGKVKMDMDDLNNLIQQSQLEMFEFEDSDEDGIMGALDEALEPSGLETLQEEESDILFNKEFKSLKKDYYLNKMKYPNVSSDVMKAEALEYVRGLQWILFYYYRGCQSWGWYYPHHYSPYVSDIRNFTHDKISFNLGQPFLPFQQLLAVLPAASKEFLPEGYQNLMVSQQSPIIDYYPKDFKFDLNGKRQEWEAVVLIPFIQEKRLLEAMEPYNSQLTDEEKYRNSHGPINVYNYSPQSLGSYSAPEYFPEIKSNHAAMREVFSKDYEVALESLVVGRHPKLSNTSGVYMPGFPLLTSLDITGSLEKKGVKVFEHASRNENMILRIKERKEFNIDMRKLCHEFITNRDHVYVSYPHLTPARVKMVISKTETGMRMGEDGVYMETNNQQTQSTWSSKLTSLKEIHIGRFGIDLSPCKIVVYAFPLEGTKLVFKPSGKAVKQMIWSSEAVGYPLDTCLLDVDLHHDITNSNQLLELSDVFPLGQLAYMIGPVDYGTPAKVVDYENEYLKVSCTSTTEPDLTPVCNAMELESTNYYPGYQCASRLGISPHLFSRITSSILVQSPHTDKDKVNLGLSLKYTRSNQQMVGFTRKEGGMWLYSDRTIDLVNEYMDKFPDLFQYLAENIQQDIFFKDKMFPNDSTCSRLTEMKAWLKEREKDKGELRSTESQLLESNIIQCLESVLDSYTEEGVVIKTIKLKPHHLYLPKAELMISQPDPDAVHEILDRIVYVRECHSIPIGTKGIIIGIEKKSSKGLLNDESGWTEAATLYDVVFDTPVVGGQALYGIKEKRVYRLTKQVFINLSYGRRKQNPNYDKNQTKSSSYYKNQSNRQNNSMNSPRGYNRANNRQQNNRQENSRVDNSRQENSRVDNSRQDQRQDNRPRPQPQSAMNQNNAALKSISNNQSGSVSDFFNAYRNVNNPPTQSAGAQTMTANLPLVSNVENQSSAGALQDSDSLSDMWNLLKNLQTSGEGESRGASVESQTFTRAQAPGFVQHQTGVLKGFFPPHGVGTPGVLGFVQQGVVKQAFVQPSSAEQLHTSNQKAGSDSNAIEQTEALKKILCIKPASQPHVDSQMRNSMKSSSTDSKFYSDETVQSQGSLPSKPSPRTTGRTPSQVQNKPCGHLPDCVKYFFSICKLYNLGKPRYDCYLHPDGSGRVITHCRLSDGFEFRGPYQQLTQDSISAMACQGIAHVMERYGQQDNQCQKQSSHQPYNQYSSSQHQNNQSNPYNQNNTKQMFYANNQQKNMSHPQHLIGNQQYHNNKSTAFQEAQQSSNWRSGGRGDLVENPGGQRTGGQSTGGGQNQSNSSKPGELSSTENKKRNRPRVKIAANFQTPLNQK